MCLQRYLFRSLTQPSEGLPITPSPWWPESKGSQKGKAVRNGVRLGNPTVNYQQEPIISLQVI